MAKKQILKTTIAEKKGNLTRTIVANYIIPYSLGDEDGTLKIVKVMSAESYKRSAFQLSVSGIKVHKKSRHKNIQYKGVTQPEL